MPFRAALAVLVAAVFAAFASPAVAAPPPTLTGQTFFGTTPPFGNSLTFECTDGAGARFRAASTTTGPYSGNYTETGELTFRRASEFEGVVAAASAEFTLQAPGVQIAGTKRFVSHVPGQGVGTNCGESPYSEMNTGEPVQMAYTATITTADGVFTDRGTATMDFADADRVLPTEFTERFTSSLSAPEQQHSVLFGKRAPGSSWSAMSANTKRASPFVLYFPGTVRRLHAYIDGNGATSGSQVVRAVLYRRDPATGGPGAYVTRSFEFTVPAGMSARWVPFWLAPPATLQPGVYWLGLQTAGQHGVARYAWDPVPNARRFNVDVDSDGPSDPFGASLSDDQQISIFAFGSY